ncbi:MAG: hypothetical protein ACXW2T_07620 [Allosphingosinicella sp.]
MRKSLIAFIAATQLASAPAWSADLIEDSSITLQQAGSFAGARVRLPLGGTETEGGLRAGLVMAPTLRSEGADHRRSLRFGNGAEIGFKQGQPLALSIAGRTVTGREAQRLSGPRAGVSTLAWVAVGTGVVLVVGTLLFVDALNDASE